MPIAPHISALIGVAPHDLAAALGPRGRLLSLDLGTRTIGLATASLEVGLASPAETLRRAKFGADAEALRRWIEREAIGGLVLGLPLNMDGTEGPRAQSTRSFALNLTRRLDETGAARPLAFVDERLSTVAADDAMVEAGVRTSDRRRHVDAAAAAEILRRFLQIVGAARPGP